MNDLAQSFLKPDFNLESPGELLKNKASSLGMEPGVSSFKAPW
jgi:hypothetical protein